MTTIAIAGDQWLIDGEITYSGTRCEGLLMNARMVNCTFEDTHRRDFDPDTNTTRFIEMISQYRDYGVHAFTLCLQGGVPGYEGAVNSAFNRDGSLRADYMARLERVVEACGDLGIAARRVSALQRIGCQIVELAAALPDVVDQLPARGPHRVDAALVFVGVGSIAAGRTGEEQRLRRPLPTLDQRQQRLALQIAWCRQATQ